MRAIACAVLAFALASPAARAQVADEHRALIPALRAHVRHVFVIYQENRSFDSYFGTFPGAENLASPLAQTHGFVQHDAIGGQAVAPFRIADPDLADVDHSRAGLFAKMAGGTMGGFVPSEESLRLKAGLSRQNAQRLGLLTMAYQDCDTVPFLWKYAHAFALYDHIFQGMSAPSTPGNIDIIGAQTGQSQWVRHPQEVVPPSDTGPGVPVYNDLYPAFGPYHGGQPKTTQIDLTFANVLLLLEGAAATGAAVDSDDVKEDVVAIAGSGRQRIPWGWYQEGLTDDGSGLYPAYVTHHNAPQYFGYIRNNPVLWSNVHDLTGFFDDVAHGTLGDRGVFYIKGGYKDPFGFAPATADPSVRAEFAGDDDHPGYSDSHVSEAMVAHVVNAIARSPYWNDSAIIITWDDSEGFYDHVPPPQFERCSDGRACGDGPRVPLILISPYAKSGAVVHDAGDHASVIKLVTALFDLPSLASLPDERPTLPDGPRDGNASLTNLLAGFDAARLNGTEAPAPPSAAIIPDDVAGAIPPPMSCASLGIDPVAVPGGLASPPPGFAPRLASP